MKEMELITDIRGVKNHLLEYIYIFLILFKNVYSISCIYQLHYKYMPR